MFRKVMLMFFFLVGVFVLVGNAVNRPQFPATQREIIREAVAGIDYRRDAEMTAFRQEWARPEVVKERGWGDCEDFVGVAMDALIKQGYECRLALGFDGKHAMLSIGDWLLTVEHDIIVNPKKAGQIEYWSYDLYLWFCDNIGGVE